MNKSLKRKKIYYFLIIAGTSIILFCLFIAYNLHEYSQGAHKDGIKMYNLQPKYRLNDSVYVIMRKHFLFHSGQVTFVQKDDTVFAIELIGETETLVIDTNKDTTITDKGDRIIVKRKR